MGGYSGGMKRRLDLALALVHRPRLLFLDEPTTGLDVQSRTALWDEVRRLAEDGVTVFLTTQYLEEADVLADRLGIIDRGRIVAEGTPAELKATIGRPSVEAHPGGPRATASASRRCCAGSARQAAASAQRRAPCGCPRASATSPRSCARSTPRASRSPICGCTAPTLDDVFLAKTGRSLEGASDRATGEEPSAQTRSRRAGQPA